VSRCPHALALAWGLVLEPLAHPKPGAVTRIAAHDDKNIYTFTASALAGLYACEAACTGPPDGFIARGLETYAGLLGGLGVETNAQLGSILLLLPLCRALTQAGTAEEAAALATTLVREHTGREDAAAYYRLLEELAPSHLGRYEGPVPSVGSGGRPESLVAALEAASWDLVHGELLNSYPATVEAYHVILGRGGPFNEDSLLAALLHVLAEHGDTLIARKWGLRAYKRALWEARAAALARPTPREALEELDELWRPRGWNPGAALDVVAAAAGLAAAHRAGFLSLEGRGRSS